MRVLHDCQGCDECQARIAQNSPGYRVTFYRVVDRGHTIEGVKMIERADGIS